jgi:hypothetical protein
MIQRLEYGKLAVGQVVVEQVAMDIARQAIGRPHQLDVAAKGLPLVVTESGASHELSI